MIGALLLCVAAHVVDGDTIRCDGIGRVRLAAIDTADKTSSSPCRRHYGNHLCDNALQAKGKAALEMATAGKQVMFRPVGMDRRNGRVVAVMSVGRVDLQCAQLAAGVARYLADYDKRYGFPVLHRCRAVVEAAPHG
jgi:endonuclease YncB( thermonuclease family)